MWNFHIMTWVMNHYSIQDEEKSSACLGRSHFPVRTTCLYEILWFYWFLQSISITCGEGKGIPLQYSCLENPTDGGAWWAAVHGVTKSRTWLTDFTFTFHFHALEKEMATHSSVLAWRIPGTREPGGLPSMGSNRVGHNWSDLAVAVADNLYANIEFREGSR